VKGFADIARELKAPWRRRAACLQRPPDEFYDKKIRVQRDAARFCHIVCPVQAECLDYALANDERHGVWGGTTEKERALLLRGRLAKVMREAEEREIQPLLRASPLSEPA
jgi:WhiB family transcriptional regulator, redox-sensing transcriptional regulator